MFGRPDSAPLQFAAIRHRCPLCQGTPACVPACGQAGIAYVSDFCSYDVLAVQLAFFVVHLCVKSGDADTSESADFKNRMEHNDSGRSRVQKEPDHRWTRSL
jgi:hypothetical protein